MKLRRLWEWRRFDPGTSWRSTMMPVTKDEVTEGETREAHEVTPVHAHPVAQEPPKPVPGIVGHWAQQRQTRMAAPAVVNVKADDPEFPATAPAVLRPSPKAE